MMDYELFKDVVKEKFLSYMPEKYHGMEVRIAQVEKVNRRLDGLSLWKAGEEKTVSPTVYLNHMYEDYVKSGDLQAVMQKAAKAMEKAFMRIPQMSLPDMQTTNIVFQLVNTKQNEEMLRDMPHREFQDLSIIYRWMISADEEEILSALIGNETAEKLGMGEEQLFQAAEENTRRLLPPVIKSMNEVMREMLLKDGMTPETADIMMGEMPLEQTMWVITNERMTGGAVSMLYEDELHRLAESVENDLYILPSSVHEVIAIPADMGKPEELARMVTEVNMDELELGDRLSNQVYHYDKDLRKITLATDTPNKRLDGVVAEQKAVYEAKQAR